MAAYASTVTLIGPRQPVQIGNALWCVLANVNITNYNQTLAEITALTGLLQGALYTVAVLGCSTLGYVARWSTTSKAFQVFDFEDTLNVPVETASDTAVGAFHVMVLGHR